MDHLYGPGIINGEVIMPPSTATQASVPTAAGAAPRTTAAVSPKTIGGIGAALTGAALAAAVMLTNWQPAADPVAPAFSQAAGQTFAGDAAVLPPARATGLFIPGAAASAPAAAPELAPVPLADARQCGLNPRKFYLSGNGVIRVRDGDYVSPPIVLDVYPQEIVMPLARPVQGITPLETVVVEGKASVVVMKSDLASFRKVFEHLRGAARFDIQWVPLKNC
jgi:hypothetical protein